MQLLPRSLKRYINKKDPVKFWFPVLLSSALFFIGALASFILVFKPQDLREQAATGKAEIIIVPNTTPLRVNEPARLSLRFNGRAEQVVGVQAGVKVSGEGMQDLAINYKNPSNLVRSWTGEENVTNGKLFTMIFLSNELTKPFVSNEFVELAEITFKPTQLTTISIGYDPVWTTAPLFNASGDGLNPPGSSTFTIAAALPTPTPTPTPKVTPTPTPKVTPTPTPKVTPTPTPTPKTTPSPTSATGGVKASPSPSAKVTAQLDIVSSPVPGVSPSPTPISIFSSPSPTLDASPIASPIVRNVPSEPPTTGNEVTDAEPGLLSRVLKWIAILLALLLLIGAALFAFFKYQEKTGQASDPLRY